MSPNAASLPGMGSMFHPSYGPVRYSVREIPNDTPDEQVESTISLMREYACEDSTNPAVVADVSRAYASDPITDTWAYLHRNGDRGMQFVRDEDSYAPFSAYEFSQPDRWTPMVESLARPEMLARIDNPHGDCDDFCTYGAAHLLARGVPCSFVTVAADGSDPTMFSHVYLCAYPADGPYAGRRVPLDLSHGAYPGWEVRQVYRREEWPVRSSAVRLFAIAAAVGVGVWAAKRRMFA